MTLTESLYQELNILQQFKNEQIINCLIILPGKKRLINLDHKLCLSFKEIQQLIKKQSPERFQNIEVFSSKNISQKEYEMKSSYLLISFDILPLSKVLTG